MTYAVWKVQLQPDPQDVKRRPKRTNCEQFPFLTFISCSSSKLVLWEEMLELFSEHAEQHSCCMRKPLNGVHCDVGTFLPRLARARNLSTLPRTFLGPKLLFLGSSNEFAFVDWRLSYALSLKTEGREKFVRRKPRTFLPRDGFSKIIVPRPAYALRLPCSEIRLRDLFQSMRFWECIPGYMQ